MTRRLHGISLLLLMIVLVVSCLGVLSAVTASSDLALAKRQAEYQTGIQDCNNQAERWLASLLESGAGAEGRTEEKQFSDGSGRMLSVKLIWEKDGITVLEWKHYTVWNDNGIDNLYQKGD